MPTEVQALIVASAEEVRDDLDSVPGRRMDCRSACSVWGHAFRKGALVVQLCGGEGVDDDVFTGDFRLVPLARRSGYRERDGIVHRHYWLAISVDGVLFDPTAHQFDPKGGVALHRYVVEGLPLRPAS